MAHQLNVIEIIARFQNKLSNLAKNYTKYKAIPIYTYVIIFNNK